MHEFNALAHRGKHRKGLDGANTFDLPRPHTDAFGIGVSFLVQASTGANTPTRFILATSGADLRA